MKELTAIPSVWLTFYLIFWSSISGNSQTWRELCSFGNQNAQSMAILAPAGDLLYFGGTFSGNLALTDVQLTSRGEEDIFLASLDSEGQVQLLLSGGSIRGDQLYDLQVDSEGNLVLAGAVWEEADFGTFQIMAPEDSPKVEFLAKLSPQGNLLWSKLFAGGSIKGLNSLSLDDQDRILLGGYYGDSLRVADTTLFSPARAAAFVGLFSGTGERKWLRSIGRSGNTRTTATAAFSDAYYYAGGYFDDTLRIDDQVFPANTDDQDAFLAAFTAEGTLRWVRKAGGVFDERPVAMAADKAGSAYLTGSLVGVMRLNDSLSIQSRDGNADCFLVKYDTLGQVKWATAFGGDQLQLVSDLAYAAGKLSLCGSFQENLFWQDRSLESTFGYDGFFARLDTAGQVLELQALPASNGTVLPRRLAPDDGNLRLGGDFSGRLALRDLSVSASSSSFDLFLATWGPAVTNTQNRWADIPIRLFPNPARDYFFLESSAEILSFRIYSAGGQLIHTGGTPRGAISTQNWPPGSYRLQVRTLSGVSWKALILK